MSLFGVASSMLLSWNCNAAVLTVDPDEGKDIGSCQASPCKSIKFALSRAAPRDSINLLSGTYRGEDNRDIEVAVENLTIASNGNARDCIIDLESLGRGFILKRVAGFVSIENLTIRNGTCSSDTTSSAVMGAGFFLDHSYATLRNLIVSNMICTHSAPMQPSFSGAALFLRDSYALIEDVEIVDCYANHGGGLATWGNEKSVVRRTKFLRNGGSFWGGCLLLEEDTSTEFHDCVFSHSTCDYGAALDDGQTAHPLFKNCIFEYGQAVHGAAGYHYGSSRTRYDGVIIRHNQASSSAAVYIVTTSKPSFRNVTFYNNSAGIHAGAIRSNYDGTDGPLMLENCKFIGNVAKGEQAGALELHAMDATFVDCVFEGNAAEGFAGAAAFNSHNLAGNPLVFERTVFRRNHAREAGALYFFGSSSQVDADNQPTVRMNNCLFEENYADKAGALLYTQAALLTIDSTVFRSNTASDKGGAIMISNFHDHLSRVQVTSSSFFGNQVDGTGGSLYCTQSDVSKTSVSMDNAIIRSSMAYGDGAGMFFGCTHMALENTSFEWNQAWGPYEYMDSNAS